MLDDPAPSILQRFAALSSNERAGITNDVRIECGSMRDYAALSRFHYRGGRPAAPTCVYRALHHTPTVIGRYLGRHGETQVIGVLVRTLPPLDCSLRAIATQHRYRGLGRKNAARMLNREMRTIARVVIDPAWRGVGLAVRLVRHALADPETIYTEALAAMGRVHPFFVRAGMTRYDRPPHRAEQRLLDALAALGVQPYMLASPQWMLKRMAALDERTKRWFDAELRRWHRTAGRMTAIADPARPSRADMLDAARKRLLSRPVYYLARIRKDASHVGEAHL